ncbi:MAG: aminotransferase class I/II-fold pyridoxal phosphate-dependent enzyme [Myxococcota bacterium]|nr:aminotransferase class I/II-fold pyridoxal phosphate-dependent enzyme [Myxococcota bacterium]
MDISSLNQAVFSVHSKGRKLGHYFAHFDDWQLAPDRTMTIGDRQVTTFASCSYLGLEYEPSIIQGAQEACARYGTQTSFSRGYLSSPLYRELEEELLPTLFGSQSVVVTSSTSSAHMIAIPALIDERDAVVCDHQVHRSVDDAVTLQCARSHARKVVIRHGELDQALDVLRTLSARHRHVWLACDGIYSMYGDYLPTSFLNEVLAVAPNIRLYVDDAHGMSWAGKYGRGHFLDRIPLSERVVLTTSFAKAFGVGGGVITSGDPELVERARLVGGPYCFSGPLRPGDLGAAAASARLHLGDQLEPRQRRLASLVQRANERLRTLGVPVVVYNEVPFFFVALGRAETVYGLADRLMLDGYHASVSGFPAVPSSRGGLRVAITASHDERAVDGVIDSIAHHLPEVLHENGVSPEELERAFRKARPCLRGDEQAASDWAEIRTRMHFEVQAPTQLQTQVVESISELDPAEWDALMVDHGCISADALAMVERVFPPDAPKPEEAWSLRYVLVRDAAGEVLAAAPLTICLMKDDFVMDARVSSAIEQRRVDDPYLFTSKVISTGTMLSEGLHLHLTDGPLRREALTALTKAMVELMQTHGCGSAIFRDIPQDPANADLRDALMGLGFVPAPMPDMFIVSVTPDEAEWLRGLKKRYRGVMRKNLERADAYSVRVVGSNALTPQELEWAHSMYMAVSNKNLGLNIFPLSPAVFQGCADSPAWEFLFLHLRPEHGGPEDGRPVAFCISHHVGGAYRALVAGLDYNHLWPFKVQDASTYRQLLLQLLRRARALGKEKLHLGMGAELEKRRLGATRHAIEAFVRSDETFDAATLREFVQALGMG